MFYPLAPGYISKNDLWKCSHSRLTPSLNDYHLMKGLAWNGLDKRLVSHQLGGGGGLQNGKGAGQVLLLLEGVGERKV